MHTNGTDVVRSHRRCGLLFAALCLALACTCVHEQLGAQTFARPRRHRAASPADTVDYPLVIGYRTMFGGDVERGESVAFGIGHLFGRDPHDAQRRQASGTFASATLELGVTDHHITIAPLVGGYVQRRIGALGLHAGLLTDGHSTCALVRPMIGAAFSSRRFGTGLLIAYGYNITIPWDQELTARSVLIIQVHFGI